MKHCPILLCLALFLVTATAAAPSKKSVSYNWIAQESMFVNNKSNHFNYTNGTNQTRSQPIYSSFNLRIYEVTYSYFIALLE